LLHWAKENKISAQYDYMREEHGINTLELMRSLTLQEIEWMLSGRFKKYGERKSVFLAIEKIKECDQDLNEKTSKKRKLSSFSAPSTLFAVPNKEVHDIPKLQMTTSHTIQSIDKKDLIEYTQSNNYLYIKDTALPLSSNSIIAIGNYNFVPNRTNKEKVQLLF